MREFERIVRIRTEERTATEHGHWWRTATLTAYIVNTIGGAVAGKTWQVKQPKYYFDMWMSQGTAAENDKKARWERALERSKARRAREAAKRAKGAENVHTS